MSPVLLHELLQGFIKRRPPSRSKVMVFQGGRQSWSQRVCWPCCEQVQALIQGRASAWQQNLVLTPTKAGAGEAVRVPSSLTTLWPQHTSCVSVILAGRWPWYPYGWRLRGCCAS